MIASLSKPQWLELPHETRLKLIEIFKIPRSEGGHITYSMYGADVESDGHSHEDLKEITIERMQAYLGSTETDFFDLFNTLLEKIKVQASTNFEEQVKRQQVKVIAK